MKSLLARPRSAVVGVALALILGLAGGALVYGAPVAGPISLVTLSVSVDPISPNDDGRYESATATYAFSEDALVTVTVLGPDEQLVRTLKSSVPEAADLHAAVWDGRDQSGTPVPAGTYTFEVAGSDNEGTSASGQATVEVAYDYINVITPVANATLSGTASLVATEGVYFDGRLAPTTVRFHYRLAGSSTWTLIGTATKVAKPGGGWTWNRTWNTIARIDGVYEVCATAAFTPPNDAAHTEYSAAQTVRVDNPLSLYSHSASVDPISPNADGRYDTTDIAYSFSDEATVTVRVLGAGDVLVKTVKPGVVEPAGSRTATWDGTDQNGTPVAAGTYTYEVSGIDGVGISASGRGTIEVAYDYVNLVSPLPDALLSGTVSLVATEGVYFTGAVDPDNVKFYYRSLGASSWTLLGTAAKVDNPEGGWTWRLDWDTTVLADGEYEIRAATTFNPPNDSNHTEYTAPRGVRISNGFTLFSHYASVDPISPNGDGRYDTTAITYQFSDSAVVTVSVLGPGDALVKSLKLNVAETVGTKSAVWDGTDQSGVPVPAGVYTYEVSGSDSDGAVASGRGTVEVAYDFINLVAPMNGATLSGAVSLVATEGVYFAGDRDPSAVRFYHRLSGSQSWILTGAAKKVDNPEGGWTWQYEWDTTARVEGLYEICAAAVFTPPFDGSHTEYSVPRSVRILNGFALIGHEASVDPISPDGDTRYDSTEITYTFSKDATTTVRVLDSEGATVRTLKSGVIELAGTRTAPWDGRNDSGALVPAGIYTYEIVGSDDTGTTLTARGTIEVAYDFLHVCVPPANATVSGKVMLVAVEGVYFAGDMNPSSSSFSYRSVGASTWSSIGTATRIDNPDGTWTWQREWDTTSLAEGAYEIRASAYFNPPNDSSHTEYSVPKPVTVDQDPPDAVTTEIHSVTPNPALLGEAITFTGHAIDSLGHPVTAYEWRDGETVLSTALSFVTSDLAAGTHTITLRAKCATSDWSAPATVMVSVTPPPSTIPLEHDSAGVAFDRFVTGYSTAYSGGGYVYSRWTGTTLKASFTGSSISWIGPKQPSYGMADVYIDGAKVATDVDCYQASPGSLSATIWESGALPDGPHTIELKLVGHKNAASSNYIVVLDRFDVTGASPSGGGTRYDDSTATPGYTGTWLHYANPTYYDKTYAYSRWAGAAFTVSFTGTRVSWIGPKTPNYGMADVYIDSVKVATVDCYKADLASQGWREVIWTSNVLTPGAHTLSIRPTGTKNPAATAANVVIDAVDVKP